MPVFHSVSEEIFLQQIWLVTLALAGFSLLVLIILVVKRFLGERRDTHHRRQRDDMARYLYAALSLRGDQKDSGTKDILPKLDKAGYHALGDAALDILRSIKGDDRRKIGALLENWGIMPVLENILRTDTRGDQIRALTLLSAIGGDHACQMLLKAAGSDDIYVQLAALRALAQQQRFEEYPADLQSKIISLVAAAKKTNILMMADALSRFGAGAASGIIRLTGHVVARDVRLAALSALGSIRALEAAPALTQLLTDEDGDVRAQSAAALGKIGDVRAIDGLIIRLNDALKPVRLQAAQALGRLGAESAMPVLVERLDDEDWWVRFRSAEALWRIGEGGRTLLNTAARGAGQSAVIAAQVLAEMETRDAR